MKKMVMAVVPRVEAEHVVDALVDAGHPVTYAESRGGMLRQSQWTLYIATETQELEAILGIIRECCNVKIKIDIGNTEDDSGLNAEPVTADVGWAIVFIWNLEGFEKY
ncbi:MAG: cyclic-di-AMP receptor [Anaerolineales bacterium]|nr:cyclic-di-AMP receptor [Anaerolineales bacterium]